MVLRSIQYNNFVNLLFERINELKRSTNKKHFY